MTATERVVRLVPPKRDDETIQGLRDALAAAESGDLIGYAAVWSYRGSDWEADAVGQCRRAPALAVTMMFRLRRKLEQLMG